MAGRPLRPATGLSLGEPLPHQLADRTRTPPQAPLRAFRSRTGVQERVCGISPSFPGLFPTRGQVVHALRTRAPRQHRPTLRSVGIGVRLACVKHAASVRSEPGSNSLAKVCPFPRLPHHRPQRSARRATRASMKELLGTGVPARMSGGVARLKGQARSSGLLSLSKSFSSLTLNLLKGQRTFFNLAG